jgi:hypothetical protein
MKLKGVLLMQQKAKFDSEAIPRSKAANTIRESSTSMKYSPDTVHFE